MDFKEHTVWRERPPIRRSSNYGKVHSSVTTYVEPAFSRKKIATTIKYCSTDFISVFSLAGTITSQVYLVVGFKPWWFTSILSLKSGAVNYELLKSNHYCKSADELLGKVTSLHQCAELCLVKEGCKFFAHGKWCYWQKTASANCSEGWVNGGYDFYEIDGKFSNA